jgi:hypothetical protein
MKLKINLLSLVICFLCACQQEKNQISKSAIIHIPLEDSPTFIDADSVFKDVTYIPLETTDESLMYDIDKLLFFDNRFYLLDRKTISTFSV